jgi:hypothetical protein
VLPEFLEERDTTYVLAVARPHGRHRGRAHTSVSACVEASTEVL